ncbi:hypothetical protein [Devosia sp. Root436]|nr:hypothetical protein [Devosia sp. Root436]
MFIVFSGLFASAPAKGHNIATGFWPANHNGVTGMSNEEKRQEVAVRWQ